jgi:TonB-linked SusC/RagA family outer membrane protein
MRWFTILCLSLAFLVPDSALAQATGRISGVVRGEAGRPLSGASVTIVGTRLGTLTAPDGRYTITGVQPGQHQVKASLIGYGDQTQGVAVTGGQAATADFQLKAQAVELEGIVAVGYGTTRKKDLTGAVASVDGDDVTLKAAPTSAVSGALQGKAPGVQVVTNSGIPGGGASVRIRGTNSITANSEPLYVIDGMPATTGTSQRDPTQNPLNTINPNDIESIQVLKDASSTAIYGARGANGVVLITTKRGKRGQNQMSLESSYGFQEISKTIPVLDAPSWMALVNEALVNGGRDPKFTSAQIASAQTYDYPGMMLRSAPQQNHTLTMSGGDAQTRYLISGNFMDQEGIVIGTDFQRYSGRLNLDREMSDRFRIGTSLSLARTAQNLSEIEDGGVGAGARGLLAAMQYDPSLPVKDANGNYIQRAIMGEQVNNPVATANELVNQRNQTRFIGNIFGEFDLAEGLRLRSSVAANLWSERSPFYAPSYIAQGSGNDGAARIWTGQSTEIVNENLVTYRRDLREGHALDLTGGFTVQNNRFEWLQAQGQGFAVDGLAWNNLGAAGRIQPAGSGASESALLSYLGRANYNLADKYLFTVTGRYDGSSRFGANSKWGFFPSAAFAWRVSDEAFMQQQGLFDDLKLRLSYGKTGNQEIGLYNSLARMDVRFAGMDGSEVVGMAPGGNAPNPDLKWESTAQFNAGMDAAFLDSRVTVSVDAYQSVTDDLLLYVGLPGTTGYWGQLQNIGSVENRGIEFALSTVNVEAEKFSWRSSLNLASNRNEVRDLGGREFIRTGGDRFGGFIQGNQTHVIQPGQPLGAIIGFQTEGLWQQGEACNLTAPRAGMDCVPGEYKFVDINGDGQINLDDRTILGYADPKFYGGLNNSFSYGPLTLDAFVNFTYGNEVVNASMVFLKNVTGFMNEHASSADRWTPENTDTEVPRANVNRPRFIHTGLVEDGSFVRLQTLTLGYQVPQGLVPGASNTRLFVTGQNLLTLTGYSGFDPEVNSLGGHPAARGLDIGAYPRSRIWNIGANVTF